MTKISFSDEKLAQALDEWSAEMGADELDEDSRAVLVQTFKDGWSACFQNNLGPAIELCLLIMRMDKLRQQQGTTELVLSDAIMEALLIRCRAVVGTVEEEGLMASVEAVDTAGTRAPTVEELSAALLISMQPMSDEERIDTIGRITDVYCSSCGGEQPETSYCSCMDDE